MPATAPARVPAQRKPAAATRPRLVLVSQRHTSAGRAPFLILIGAVLVCGLVGVLLLHMLAAQDAFRANDLQQRLTALTNSEQQLAGTVETDSSPLNLQRRAVLLGMVPSAVTGLRRLRDGRAVGVQKPIIVTPPPPVVTSNSAKTAKTATGKAGKTATAGKAGKAGKAATAGKAGKAATAGKAGKAAKATTKATKSQQHHAHRPAQP